MIAIKADGPRAFFAVELGVNYITHLYTLAEAGFEDRGYVQQHGAGLPASALDYLRSKAKLFSFHRRDHGPFAGLLYFTPAYFNFTSITALKAYFGAWEEAVRHKNHGPFIQYSLHPQHLVEFFAMDQKTWEEH